MTIETSFPRINESIQDIDKCAAEEKFEDALDIIHQLQAEAQTNPYINLGQLEIQEKVINIRILRKRFSVTADQLRREQKAPDIGNAAKIQALIKEMQELIVQIGNSGEKVQDERKELARLISGKGAKKAIKERTPKKIEKINPELPSESSIEKEMTELKKTELDVVSPPPPPIMPKLVPPPPAPTTPETEYEEEIDFDDQDLPIFDEPPKPVQASKLAPPAVNSPKVIPAKIEKKPADTSFSLAKEFEAHLQAVHQQPNSVIQPQAKAPPNSIDDEEEEEAPNQILSELPKMPTRQPKVIEADDKEAENIIEHTELTDSTQIVHDSEEEIPDSNNPYREEWDANFFRTQVKQIYSKFLAANFQNLPLVSADPELNALKHIYDGIMFRKYRLDGAPEDEILQIIMFKILPLNGQIGFTPQGINYSPCSPDSTDIIPQLKIELLGEPTIHLKRIRNTVVELSDLTQNKAIKTVQDLIKGVIPQIIIKPGQKMWEMFDGPRRVHVDITGAIITPHPPQAKVSKEMLWFGLRKFGCYIITPDQFTPWLDSRVKKISGILAYNRAQLIPETSAEPVIPITPPEVIRRTFIYSVISLVSWSILLLCSLINVVMWGQQTIFAGIMAFYGFVVIDLFRRFVKKKAGHSGIQTIWDPLNLSGSQIHALEPYLDPNIIAQCKRDSPDQISLSTPEPIERRPSKKEKAAIISKSARPQEIASESFSKQMQIQNFLSEED